MSQQSNVAQKGISQGFKTGTRTPVSQDESLKRFMKDLLLLLRFFKSREEPCLQISTRMNGLKLGFIYNYQRFVARVPNVFQGKSSYVRLSRVFLRSQPRGLAKLSQVQEM